ncbi:DUF3300 domain-containing protein [Paraburkholderia fynbosensis]|uniref:DUF3300 domain-containing protein n=1 Tax=Paraburkholderia fynbosensis TaxID=1200993 RepID=A0A6J5FVS6_9BURK|nr:DUF3300 domain-containing protein [Paraburkholderia fynbosensis]CAB3788098.1 hypothetical protein LMG27177_02334 [Paraburkholderia fynbosensis]
MDRITRAFERIIPFARAAGRWRAAMLHVSTRAPVANHALIAAMLAVCATFGATSSQAQAPAASGGAPAAIPAATLDKLVGPIALYPDDLIAIMLPAATYPVEIVQADRFLEQRKSDKALTVNESWHDPVKALLNYPEVVKKMSADLDWTIGLGEAVVADQGAVLEAVQRFRRQTQSAGQLKSDDKQVVVVEKEIIKIVPADPQVIYVPQYNPTTVVVSGAPPSYGYLPAPYPVYYYPYPPGAALATGLVWGAAMAAVWHGGHYATHYGGGGNNNINVNRERNVERGNINTGDVNRSRSGTGQTSAWRPDKKPGQVSGTTGRATSTPRVGDPPARGSAGGGNAAAGGRNQAARRPATPATREAGARESATREAGARDSGARASQTPRGGDAFSGYGSARDAQANSSRGAASRQSISQSPARTAPAAAHSGGGFSGGGGRGGGGGGGGGFSGRGGGGRGGGRR